MTKAIDILNNQLLSDSFALRASGMTGFAYANSQQLLVREALQALHTSLLELVGEDEPWNVKQNYGYRQQYQNELKAELRTKLNDYFREEE